MAAEVRSFDPLAALDGGPDGLAMYRHLARPVETIVIPGGWVIFEVGHDQADAVADFMVGDSSRIERTGVRMRHDVSGIRRCVAGKTLG